MEATASAAAAQPDRGLIVVLNVDLMFGARIRNGVQALGYRVSFVRDTERFAAALRGSQPPPVLGIVDMNTAVDWAIIRELTADPARATPLLAFGPHVDAAGRRAAKAAGVDRIVANGEFHRSMLDLVQRYAAAPA